MGAWAYCCECDEGFDPPSAQEVVDGYRLCRKGHKNWVSTTKDELLVQLEERIKALEERKPSRSKR